MIDIRAVVESLYTGVCNIYEHQKSINEESMATELSEILIYENVPCRLSHCSGGSAADKAEYNEAVQGVEIFISPDIEVKTGSVIEVTQNGITRRYKKSGETRVYSTHQQIYAEKLVKHRRGR